MLRQQGLKPDGSKESELTHISQTDVEKDLNAAGDDLLEDMDIQEGENLCAGADRKGALLQKILEEERVTPMFNVKVLVGLFIVVLAINLLKGGGAFPSPLGIKCGSQDFWIANGIILGWIFLISVYVRKYLVKRNSLKQRVGYENVEGDIQWDAHATVVYPGICCLAGFFCRNVWNWRWYSKRSSNVSYGRAPSSCICIVGMHDFFYKFHSNDFILCIWFTGSTVWTGVFLCWIYCNVLRTDRIVNIDATSTKKFLHSLFHWWCSTT